MGFGSGRQIPEKANPGKNKGVVFAIALLSWGPLVGGGWLTSLYINQGTLWDCLYLVRYASFRSLVEGWLCVCVYSDTGVVHSLILVMAWHGSERQGPLSGPGT